MSRLPTLLLVLLLASPAFAQQNPPPGGDPHPFTLPPTTDFVLDNGMAVTLVPYGAIPKVSVALYVRAGNLNERADEVWLADLTGDLMQEGAGDRDATRIATDAASMGGSVGVTVGLDQTTISGSVLSEYVTDLVNIVADIALRPNLPEDELERLRRDRLRTLSVQRAQPATMALERFRERLYGDHPYGRLFPTEAMLEGYSIQDVRAFYAGNFGAVRSRLYVVGRFDLAAAEAAIRRAFAEWESGPPPATNVPEATAGRVVDIVDLPGAAQSNVYVGLPVIDPSHPDWIALQVTNALLGGSFGSRITANIREDKGYTYSPYSQLSSRYRDTYWAEIAAITTSVTGAALDEIFHEIRRLRDEPPPPDELEGIKTFMAGTFVLQNSAPDFIIGQLAYLDFHGIDRDYLETYVQNVLAVTPEDVQRMADMYLRDEDMLIVLSGDRAAVEPQVERFR